MRLYVKQLTDRQKDDAVQAGHTKCCNVAHGPNPPDIDFNRNPAALDALMRKNWCVCGPCHRRFFQNGRHPKINIVENGGVLSDIRDLLMGSRG